MAWLLDTNVVPELRRAKPDPNVLAFIGRLQLDQSFISVVTLAELRFGIELVTDPTRRADLNNWLNNPSSAHVRTTRCSDLRRYSGQMSADGGGRKKVWACVSVLNPWKESP